MSTPILVALIAAGLLAVTCAVLAWRLRRPLSDVDRRLSMVDVDIDRQAQARQARRVARQRDREGMRFGSVTVLSDARRTHKR